MAKKTLTKSAVFQYFTITTDEKYFVCQCMIDDDDGERLCETKLSSFFLAMIKMLQQELQI